VFPRYVQCARRDAVYTVVQVLTTYFLSTVEQRGSSEPLGTWNEGGLRGVLARQMTISH